MTNTVPLAERMRPMGLESFIGQEHLTGEGAVLRKAIESGRIPSLLLWGPPGVGKTTLAQIISSSVNRPFESLSAVSAGVKDLREIIERAKTKSLFQAFPILFIDEIHRFNKSQQDALLGAVEKGYITLIGATTENPSFEVNPALLSRCQIYILKSLDRADLLKILQQAIELDETYKLRNVVLTETAALLQLSGGDARKLLNTFELVAESFADAENIVITDQMVMSIAQQKIALYDKAGEQHYNIVSAFIKSMRGSDPNAAVYWMARMLEGGEDIEFIARRMVILASEDIGLANPNALLMATTCMQAIKMIGMPESRIILSQTAIYLALSPKSNSAYMAIDDAIRIAKTGGDLPVPLHLNNAPTKLMKELGYGKDYQYAHSFEGNFVDIAFMPPQLDGEMLYKPGQNPNELKHLEALRAKWKDRYKY